jgi:hypothetical protein
MYVNDPAITPDRIKAPWKLDQGKQPAPTLRVRKFLGRETILELSGLPSGHYASSCVGRYTRETCNHNEYPTYKGTRLADGKAIWFCEDSWLVGNKEDIGTLNCFVCIDDCARTPDAVQSTWRVATGAAEYDERVQVCGALAQPSSSATTTSPSQAQQLSSAPPKLAIVGTTMECENYDGVYTKQQRKVSGRVVYEGGRNGKQAIWYHQSGTWLVGAAENVGTGSCCMCTDADYSAVTPTEITEPWQVPLIEPCSSIRVSKSKKKHTKVIEVKGVPTSDQWWHVMNGKYRQSCMIGGRPSFKGGQDGKRKLWFDERQGKWHGGHEDFVGAVGNNNLIEATDMAVTPNEVKAVWCVITGLKPSPYPNAIVPSVEAAKQEVPRLMQLKMCELVVAQHMRCLGCGQEYTAQAEVMFRTKCMHHHCVWCGEELGGDVCAVCAKEGGGE